jgi:hypothetical protein
VRLVKTAAVLVAALFALVAVQAVSAQRIEQIEKPIADYDVDVEPVSRTVVDPRSAYEPSEGRSFDGGVIADDVVPKSAGCRTKVAWIGLKNVFGTYLWKYFQKLGWCWKNGEITSATPRCRGTWAEVYFPLWDFNGHIDCDASGGLGQTFVRRWRQGKFRLCTAYCIQTKTPWVNVRGSATGTFNSSYGM